MHVSILLITIIVIGVTSREVEFPSYNYFDQEMIAVQLHKTLSSLKSKGFTPLDIENAFPFSKQVDTLRYRLDDSKDTPDEMWEQFKVSNDTGISTACKNDVLQLPNLSETQRLRSKYSLKNSSLRKALSKSCLSELNFLIDQDA